MTYTSVRLQVDRMTTSEVCSLWASPLSSLGRRSPDTAMRSRSVERCGSVVRSYDDDRHAFRRSLATARWPRRISSSMVRSSADRQSTNTTGPGQFGPDLGDDLDQHRQLLGVEAEEAVDPVLEGVRRPTGSPPGPGRRSTR